MAYYHHGEHTKHTSNERVNRSSPRKPTPSEERVATLCSQHRRKSPALSQNRMPSQRKREGDGRRVATMPANAEAKGLRVYRRNTNRRHQNQSNGHRTPEPKQGTQLYHRQKWTNMERFTFRPLCRWSHRDIGKQLTRNTMEQTHEYRTAIQMKREQWVPAHGGT